MFSHNVRQFLTSIHARLSLGHKGFTKNLRSSSKNAQFNVYSRFNFRKREHEFIEEFHYLNLGRPFSFKNLDDSDEATFALEKWATIPTTRALPSPLFTPLDLHRSIHKLPRVTSRFADCEIKS